MTDQTSIVMDSVVITKSEYEALRRDSIVLGALYAAGVDNWEWYGDAIESLEEDNE